MKDGKRKKRKVRRRVISYSCKKGEKSSTNVMQEDWDEHESMVEERCEETDVLIVKLEAMRMRRMCSGFLKEVLSTLELRDHLKSLDLDELTATK
eukprot:2651969-Ditylum_brightwellii.AAC.1